MEWSYLEVLVIWIIIKILGIFMCNQMLFISDEKLSETRDSDLFSSSNIDINNVKLVSIKQ